MQASLLYGSGKLKFELPEQADITVIRPKNPPQLQDCEEILRNSLLKPVGCQPLPDLIDRRSKVGIIFNDITRATPNETIINAILDTLNFLPKENITLYNALGTHRTNTEQEMRTMLSDQLVDSFQIIQNNAFDKSTQKYLGETKSGAGIWINKHLLGNDLIILTGFIEPHFFAGFSGGGKAVMPGMAGFDTIIENHGAKYIGDEKSTWGVLGENPIQQQIREIIKKIPHSILVNVSLNDDKDITGVFSGDVIRAHNIGCAFVKQMAMIPVTDPFDIVITSNSGYPLDQNLYQSVKGMSAAAQIVKQGGTIIIAAECRDGIPDHGLFGKLLSEAESMESLLERIYQPEFKRLDQWQVQLLAKIKQKADIIVYSDFLGKQTLESRFLSSTGSIPSTVADLLTKYGSKTTIGLLPEGPLTITYLKS